VACPEGEGCGRIFSISVSWIELGERFLRGHEKEGREGGRILGHLISFCVLGKWATRLRWVFKEGKEEAETYSPVLIG